MIEKYITIFLNYVCNAKTCYDSVLKKTLRSLPMIVCGGDVLAI